MVTGTADMGASQNWTQIGQDIDGGEALEDEFGSEFLLIVMNMMLWVL